MEIDKKRICDAVVKLQNGDGKAFEDLYNLTYNTARFTAIKITKNEQDAEDVLQEAYIKVLEKINTIDKPESFISWFNMIVANKARDVMRKSRADVFSSYDREDDEGNSVSAIDQLEDDNSEYVPGDNVEKEELRKDVMKLIDGLSEEKRAAVILYYYNELSIKQIADALKISEGTVKSRLFNAKKEIAAGVEMLKKKGKVFGVAPIPLVIWALKASSVAAGTAYTAAGAAAVTLSAVTAGSVAATASGATATVGTGAAVVTGLTLAQKVAIGVVSAAIVTGGAIGTNAVIKNKSNKVTKTETAITLETTTIPLSVDADTTSEPLKNDISEEIIEDETELVSETSGLVVTSISTASPTLNVSPTSKVPDTTGSISSPTVVSNKATTSRRTVSTSILDTTTAARKGTTTTRNTITTKESTTIQNLTSSSPNIVVTTKQTTTESKTKSKATVNINITQSGTHVGTTTIQVEDGKTFTSNDALAAVANKGYDVTYAIYTGLDLPLTVVGGKTYSLTVDVE